MKLHLDANQSENCPRAGHALLLDRYKTPHYPCRVGTVSEALAHCVPSLPGKEIKRLFLFPPKLCLRISIQHWCTEAKILATPSLPRSKWVGAKPRHCPGAERGEKGSAPSSIRGTAGRGGS